MYVLWTTLTQNPSYAPGGRLPEVGQAQSHPQVLSPCSCLQLVESDSCRCRVSAGSEDVGAVYRNHQVLHPQGKFSALNCAIW